MRVVCTECDKDLTDAAMVLGSVIEVQKAHTRVHERIWMSEVIEYLLLNLEDPRAEKLYDQAKRMKDYVVVL